MNVVLLANLALSSGVAWVAPQREATWPLPFLGIVALDFSAYVAHVLLHKVPAAWRFHRVHHSDEAVDVTTALRQHPGETPNMHKVHHSRPTGDRLELREPLLRVGPDVRHVHEARRLRDAAVRAG